MKAIKSIYGKVVMIKVKCPVCKRMCFIDDGKTCCDVKVSNVVITGQKQEVGGDSTRKHLTTMQKERILELQDNRCIYCGGKFGDYMWNNKKQEFVIFKPQYDHFVAWSFCGKTDKSNMFAACSICNGIKSNRHFDTFDEARTYILNRREDKGYDAKN